MDDFSSSDTFWMITLAFLFGGLILAQWALAMFSDSTLGKLARSVGNIFGWWKNSEALTTPAIGLAFLLFGVAFTAGTLGMSKQGMRIIVIVAMACMVVALISVIPFRLPDAMYPEKRLEKRQQQALTQVDSGSYPADRHFAEGIVPPSHSDPTTSHSDPTRLTQPEHQEFKSDNNHRSDGGY